MQQTCTVVVPQKLGDVEAAERVAVVARQFQSNITLNSSDFETDAKSLFGILLLSAAAGRQLSIVADGPDASSAVTALSDLFQEDTCKAA